MTTGPLVYLQRAVVDEVRESDACSKANNKGQDKDGNRSDEESGRDDKHGGSKKESSTDHTDSENEGQQQTTKGTTTHKEHKTTSFWDYMNKNQPTVHGVCKQDFPKIHLPYSQLSPHRSRKYSRSCSRSRRSRSRSQDKSCCESQSDSSDDDDVNDVESYVYYKCNRKNLLKIEKLTDSDSRSREKMRRRALSPPSSSDEENLHIGWVAYPVTSSLTHLQRGQRKARSRQRPLCTCVDALRCIFSPVTRACNLCKSNKVHDVNESKGILKVKMKTE